jgi:hypothetical protein
MPPSWTHLLNLRNGELDALARGRPQPMNVSGRRLRTHRVAKPEVPRFFRQRRTTPHGLYRTGVSALCAVVFLWAGQAV